TSRQNTAEAGSNAQYCATAGAKRERTKSRDCEKTGSQQAAGGSAIKINATCCSPSGGVTATSFKTVANSPATSCRRSGKTCASFPRDSARRLEDQSRKIAIIYVLC